MESKVAGKKLKLTSKGFFEAIASPPPSGGSVARPKKSSYFLCLETKKVSKESSRLQIILGLIF